MLQMRMPVVQSSPSPSSSSSPPENWLTFQPLLISLRRSGLLWELPCGEIKGPQSVGEDDPAGGEKKEVTVDFHFSLWKLPLLLFDLMWSAGRSLECILFELRASVFCHRCGGGLQVLGKLLNKKKYFLQKQHCVRMYPTII